MKTKDLIKMLQEEDPTGEGHIRMSGGMPTFVESKEGYWDGPYSYIDENGNYVYSIEGYKVDIHCTDVEDYVMDLVDIHEENNWENIKNKFMFKLNGYATKEQRQERADKIINKAKETFDEVTGFTKKLFQESIDDAIKRSNEGWKFFQDKRVDDKSDKNSGFYTYSFWKIVSIDGTKNTSSVHDTEGILKSGLFEKFDNNVEPGYYEWKMKNKAK